MTADAPPKPELERAITSAAASMHMSGSTVSEVERVAAGELATGRISFVEYSRRVDLQQE